MTNNAEKQLVYKLKSQINNIRKKRKKREKMTTSRAHAKQINKFKITRAHAIEMRNSDIGISKAELQKYIDNHDNLSGIIDSSSIISLKNLLIVDSKENSAENLKYSDIYQAIEVDLVLVESPSDCRIKFILTDIIIDFLRKKITHAAKSQQVLIR